MSDIADVPFSDPTVPRPQVDMHADRGGTTVYQNPGTIQTTVYNYNQPQLIKHWQVPAPPVLDKTFVGREEELRQLMEYLTTGEDVTIVGKAQALTLQGMGGIGKTYLALKLANELYDRFPGGVLWIVVGPEVIDETSAQGPLSRLASSAFDGITLIGQLDPEQVRAWLQETAPGPFLVIFDDVWSQVSLRFLARALPTNAVRLVTTRYVQIPRILGGKMIPLDRLTPEDGLALLEDRLGCQGNTTYRTDLEELVKLLDGHALALDITAARIPDLSWIPIVLKDLKKGIGLSKLDGLKLSEERDLNVEKSLGLTYDRMTAEQQSRFRALGVFAPETPITPEAAAVIWDLNGEDATQQALFYLRDLANLALLTEVEKPPTPIYRQHGLLRVYAYALLEKEDELTSTGRAHAQYYTELALHTEIADYPVLDQHIPNLVAALHWSAANEPVLLSRMLEASFQLLLVRGQSERIEGYLPNAVAAAAENPIRQANLLVSLGDLESRLGNLDQARSHYDAALPLFRAERDRLGEAGVFTSLGDMFTAQEEWTQARTSYEQALPLFVAEREPIGQANTLIDLGRARFELGDHEQGMRDVQQAAALYRFLRDEEWAQRAERYLAEMRIRLEHPEMDTELFDAFLNVQSSQEMLQLVQQHPRLLTDEWFTLVEALIASQEDEQNKEVLRQRLDTLKRIRRALEQGASESSESGRVVVEFARADWARRRQLLTEHTDLLLNENIEPAFDGLLEVNTDPGAIRILEEVRILLRRCRTWGVDPVEFFDLHMHLGDSIEIPTEYEPVVMQIATLLSNQSKDNTALEQAIQAMQTLLNQLDAETPGLFRAALLRDLADTMLTLPTNHPAWNLDQIEAYHLEALPHYQAAGRQIGVARLSMNLADLYLTKKSVGSSQNVL